MVTPSPDPRAWKVAIALGLESGLDWARWARKRYPNPDCDKCCGQGGRRDDDVPDQWHPCECLRPVPAPWDADAYRDDRARRGVEPGPMPSLDYGDVELEKFNDGVVAWSVYTANEVQVRVGRAMAWVKVREHGPFKGTVRIALTTALLGASVDDANAALRLATAAAKAMAQP